MFAAYKWSQCNTRPHHGIYIWTAGQWANPNYRCSFVWKGTYGRHEAMRYTKWDKDQPNNHGGNEACVNLLKRHGYTWNDEPCYNRYCFICENYRVPIGGSRSRQGCNWVASLLIYVIFMCQYNLTCNWLQVLVLVLCVRNKTPWASDFLVD